MSDDAIANDETPRARAKAALAALPRRALAVVALVMLVTLGLVLRHHAAHVGLTRSRDTLFRKGIFSHRCTSGECATCENYPVPPWRWTTAEWKDLVFWWSGERGARLSELEGK